MRAAVYREYGSAQVVHLEDVALPTPAKGEIRIRVHAAEVTKADTELRKCAFPVSWFWLPLRLALGVRRPKRTVLGGYFSGVVDAVGQGVVRFREGDAIFGAAGMRFGAHAEYLCLPESYTLAAKPERMSHEEAAAVPLGGLNALHFMRRAQVRPGESVLVIGAGGSIGAHAVMIAKAMGGVVTAVDAGRKEQFLHGLGADRFIDYQTQNFAESGERYDVVMNMVVSSSYAQCVGALRAGGRYLLGNPRLSDMVRAAWTNRRTDKKVTFAFAGETQEELETLRAMIEDGKIRPIVDRALPLARASEAHLLVETEQRLGAVVLSM